MRGRREQRSVNRQPSTVNRQPSTTNYQGQILYNQRLRPFISAFPLGK
ncbi:hypothetical protein [Scytonema millei]|uniref:Uncharacterized protein n=1 Tax=Scytonema millei VB511283 TaxID=1245923 RepID=A0A9X5E3V7_9CYAN|nr:hypothetical protein [Scytonema millei]NHC34657.1 hypothetical protein [Scytonema millei VB511283]